MAAAPVSPFEQHQNLFAKAQIDREIDGLMITISVLHTKLAVASSENKRTAIKQVIEYLKTIVLESITELKAVSLDLCRAPET